MFDRILLQNINHWIDSREILIIYGARQVGKTTLLKMLLQEKAGSLIINCEIPHISNILENRDIGSIRALFGNNRYIGLDEAQKISNIGSLLKLIYDELPEYKIFATGSSSFDLANKITEPLTGRNIKFRLFPLSLEETSLKYGWNWNLHNLSDLLIYGQYPGIVNSAIEDRTTRLSGLCGDYLYQDILIQEQIKNPSVLRRLLRALAHHVGSQVSLNELSNLLGISRPTVEKYIDLLEKSFVIFSLESFSGNLRNEIKKSRKYYFYDNGIMNALTGNFMNTENRNDMGIIWENFCISERLKYNLYHNTNSSMFFWRTYDGAEIDLVENCNGEIRAFEFKWNKKPGYRFPDSFAQKYKPVKTVLLTKENLHEIL